MISYIFTNPITIITFASLLKCCQIGLDVLICQRVVSFPAACSALMGQQTYIMNLLDQLFQYSLRSDCSSISFSALDYDQNLESSSIAHSLAFYPPQHSVDHTHIINQEGKHSVLTQNFEESMVSSWHKENYVQYKEKYKKISRMTEMFANKIRKIQYEFMVKLENYCKSTLSHSQIHEKYHEQLTKSHTTMVEQSRKNRIILCEKLSMVYTNKVAELLRFGFTAVQKKSLNMEKLEYLYSSLYSILKSKKHSTWKHLMATFKPNQIKIKANTHKEYKSRACKGISVKIDDFIPIFIEHSPENVSLKVPIHHPQRREHESMDICDNLNMFISFPYQLFQKHLTQAEPLQVSIIKHVSDSELKREKRKSDLTNISGASQIQQCMKVFQQSELDQRFDYELPAFGLSHSNLQQDSSDRTPNAQPMPEENKENDGQHFTHRFSLEDHQSELNKYINFRRSIDKKKECTLKEIEKSKETIKKIVYQIQKQKNHNEKQKIKLTSKKTTAHSKSNSKKPPSASKPSTPIRTKSIGPKTPQQSAKKSSHKGDMKICTTREKQANERPIMDCLRQYQTVSKNIEVYSDYMKAKRNSIKVNEPSHQKTAKGSAQGDFAKKSSMVKHEKAQNNLLIISKDPMIRGRRIDVKVQFAKPSANGRLLEQKQKGVVKKSKK